MNSKYYLQFENKFRGDRQSIFNQYAEYDSLIELVLNNTKNPRLLDIGCGRGEWLERHKDKFKDSLGIEKDLDMAKVCRDLDLDIIQGDAIESILKLENNSFTVISLFHIIEHLNHSILIRLLKECYRVLNEDGIIIMETPSIDNLLVSSKLFYTDPTHISHINPDSLSFDLSSIGFDDNKYFYIHGGPLKDSNPLKTTRILNGVAQDVLFIGSKSDNTTKLIFQDNKDWQSHLNLGLSTLEAAVEFDINLDQFLSSTERLSSDIGDRINEYNTLNSDFSAVKSEIDCLKSEINLFKSELKYFIYLLKVFKIILRPPFQFLRYFKRLTLYLISAMKKFLLAIFNKIFNIFAQYNLTRRFILNKQVMYIINLLLKNVFGRSSLINISQVEHKLNRINHIYSESLRFNERLILHHKNSLKSNSYSKIFKK
tara:strand:- start:5540 stop:6823 length:1284 start_codon:yes stop_codon:yes gene_type:complete